MGVLKDMTGMKFGRLFVLHRDGSNKQGYATWSCVCDCGKEKVIDGRHLRDGNTKSCGCFLREASRARAWKGGRIIDNHGYVRLQDQKHPNAMKNGYVMEHIKVMSGKIGRPIKNKETVHHKNGFKADNRPSNLELWTNSHAKGQRAEDLVDFAIGILEEYAPEKLRKCKKVMAWDGCDSVLYETYIQAGP